MRIKLKVREILELEREMEVTADELQELKEMKQVELDEFAANLMHGNRNDIKQAHGEFAEFKELPA